MMNYWTRLLNMSDLSYQYPLLSGGKGLYITRYSGHRCILKPQLKLLQSSFGFGVYGRSALFRIEWKIYFAVQYNSETNKLPSRESERKF